MLNKILLIFLLFEATFGGTTDDVFEFSGELFGNFTLQLEENQPAIQKLIGKLNEIVNDTDSNLVKQLESKVNEQSIIIERQQAAIDELQTKQILLDGKLNFANQSGKWEHVCNFIPQGAYLGGHVKGFPSYISKINSGTWIIPGRVTTDNNKIYYTHDKREYSSNCYEILVGGRYKWEKSSNGAVVPGAVKIDQKGLFIGRTYYKESLVVGKVDTRTGYKGLYLAWSGYEYKLSEYEILVEDPWVV